MPYGGGLDAVAHGDEVVGMPHVLRLFWNEYHLSVGGVIMVCGGGVIMVCGGGDTMVHRGEQKWWNGKKREKGDREKAKYEVSNR